MKRLALLTTTIVAIAVMIGAQGCTLWKPAGPVIAGGQVTHFKFGPELTGEPVDVDVTGPWEVVAHPETNEIDFSATCHHPPGTVYEVTSIGKVDGYVELDDRTLTITGATFTFETEDNSIIVKGTIIVNADTSDLTVDVGPTGPDEIENIDGNVEGFIG